MSEKNSPETSPDVREYVRQRYGNIAEKSSAAAASCCGGGDQAASGCCGSEDPQALIKVSQIYEMPEVADLPQEVTNLSLGCGDPVTLASLQPGQVVLDLGSGGGIDCFLAAKKVGQSGKVIGVDMTPQMIDRARANQAKLGATNVEFRLGEIEHLPVADQSVNVIISNCVINLSPDKPQVFREAFRALKPGGRLSVSDIVTDGPLPEVVKRSLSAWAGCVAGALDSRDYLAALKAAGFVDIQLTPVYWDKPMVDEALEQLKLSHQIEKGHQVLVYQEGDETQVFDLGKAEAGEADRLYKAVYSAKVTARKPSA